MIRWFSAHRGKVLLIAAIITVILLAQTTGLTEHLTFENLKSNRDQLQGFVQANYLAAVTTFIIAFIVMAALSIPGAAVLTLAAGFVFGMVPATIYVNIGATGGATLAFLIVRYLAGNWVNRKYASRLATFNADLAKNGPYYLLSLRLIPVFPFFLINIAAGLTKIPLSTFIWTTMAGILPGDLVFTFTGSQLANIDSPKDILSANVVTALLLLAAVSIVPAVYNHVKGRTSR